MPRRSSFRLLSLLILGFVIGHRPADGQGSARVAGVVTDPTGAVLANAAVEITEASTGATRKMITSSEGSYIFLDLPPGEYTLAAKASGFKSFSQSGITVQV